MNLELLPLGLSHVKVFLHKFEPGLCLPESPIGEVRATTVPSKCLLLERSARIVEQLLCRLNAMLLLKKCSRNVELYYCAV
jgi:hypothetical protein